MFCINAVKPAPSSNVALAMQAATCQFDFATTSRRPLSLRGEAIASAALALLCLVLFIYRLSDRDLTSSHEARAAQDAQSMLTSGDWGLPRLFDGHVEMQKPPLYYWLVALLGAIAGEVDGWCVRLPAALSAAACVLLLWIWGWRRGRPLAGILAALMLATALHFTTLARIGRIDMPLTFTVALSLVALVEGRERRLRRGGSAGRGWFLLGYLAVAAGVMLKGPIAIFLPLAVAGAWRIVERKRTQRVALDLHWGVPLVLLLTLPWFLWANWATDGEWFRVFFWHHNLDRGLGTEDKLRAYPVWFYGPQLLIDFLPWSVLLPLGLIHAWRNRDDREARFGAVWLLAMLVLLSLMRFKRSDYLLPALPGAAWMLGCAGEAWYRRRRGRWPVVAFGVVMAATVALWLAYCTFIVPVVEESRTHRRFAELVRQQTDGKVLFFRAEDHNVAFLVGPPQRSLLEWENLDLWAGKLQTTYIIMPPECVAEWPKHLTAGTLEVVASSEGLATPARRWPALLSRFIDFDDAILDTREKPLVLVRTRRST
jgi:4-amino-4-deoxy-L-arabinose transferase-like glycosyltransferase